MNVAAFEITSLQYFRTLNYRVSCSVLFPFHTFIQLLCSNFVWHGIRRKLTMFNSNFRKICHLIFLIWRPW